MEDIYGVDITKPVSPKAALGAVLECFYQAHCQDSGIAEESGARRSYCQSLVRKFFEESGRDFDNPDKDGIIKLIEKLADFSKNFREPAIIQAHQAEIKKVVDVIK